MVENSIDAGADKISVKIFEGGSRLIIVSDNGTGIQKDDLVLAIGDNSLTLVDRGLETFGDTFLDIV